MVVVTSCTSAITAPTPELPFEPEPDIDKDRQHRQRHRHDPVFEKFSRHLWADELGPAVLDILVERALDRVDRFLLRGVPARLALDADQDVRYLAELLKRDIAKAERRELTPHVGDVGRPLGPNLDQNAALEVDAEIEALGEGQRDRGSEKQRAEHEEQLALRDETDVDAGGDQIECFHDLSLPHNGSSVGRLERNQVTTNIRVSMIAVNIDVTIPMANVTAKPRTGPDPNE